MITFFSFITALFLSAGHCVKIFGISVIDLPSNHGKKVTTSFRINKVYAVLLLFIVGCSTNVKSTDKYSPAKPVISFENSTSTYTYANPTISAIETPILLATATPEATSKLLNNTIMALTFDGSNDIVLVNSAGDIISMTDTNKLGEGSLLSVNWGNDPCELLVSISTNEEAKVLGIDLSGKYTETYLHVFQRDEEKWNTCPTISPTKQWGTYAVWSGEFFWDGAQKQDVEVLNLGDDQTKYRITQNGGSNKMGAVWSNQGDYLAFSDYDANGYLQFFISDPFGIDHRQLTSFQYQNIIPGSIKWERTDQRFATVIYGDKQTFVSQLWIVSKVNEAVLVKIDPLLPLSSEEFVWNNSGDQLIVHTKNGQHGQDEIVFIDPTTGSVLKRMIPEIPGIVSIFPLNAEDELGALSLDGGIYTLNYRTDTYQKILEQSAYRSKLRGAVHIMPSPIIVNINLCQK